MQAARKWGEDGDEKTVLDYSQKDNEEAAAEGKLDQNKPMADLSLKSRVDEFEDEDEEEGSALPRRWLSWDSILHSTPYLGHLCRH